MIKLREKIKFTNTIGVPYIYKGVQYVIGDCHSLTSDEGGIEAQCCEEKLPETVEILDDTETVNLRYGNKAYTSNIKEVVLPSSVHYINTRCFAESYNLQKISPIRDCYIGHEAFKRTGLREVTVENSRIDDDAFIFSDLVKVHLRHCFLGTSVFNDCKSLKTVTIDAFSPLKNYRENTIPTQTFKGCKNLTEVTTTGDKLKYVNEQAFSGCHSLTNINLSECIRLEGIALGYCESLVDLDLPKCTTIAYGTFMRCHRLKRVNLPRCEKIPRYAFIGCTSLKFLNIEKAVQVDSEALKGCCSLEYLVSPRKAEILQGLKDCTGVKEAFLNDMTSYDTLNQLHEVLPKTTKFVVSPYMYHLDSVKALNKVGGREFEVVKGLQDYIDNVYSSVL